MAEHVYRIRYSVQNGEFTKADLRGDGGCDAMMVVSIIRGPDGAVSHAFPSRDGDTGEELAPIELFKAWSALAHTLAEQADLPAWQKAIARDAFERVRQTALLLGGAS
jgi:hypothetical protein